MSRNHKGHRLEFSSRSLLSRNILLSVKIKQGEWMMCFVALWVPCMLLGFIRLNNPYGLALLQGSGTRPATLTGHYCASSWDQLRSEPQQQGLWIAPCSHYPHFTRPQCSKRPLACTVGLSVGQRFATPVFRCHLKKCGWQKYDVRKDETETSI